MSYRVEENSTRWRYVVQGGGRVVHAVYVEAGFAKWRQVVPDGGRECQHRADSCKVEGGK
jgi:hypothetical protein